MSGSTQTTMRVKAVTDGQRIGHATWSVTDAAEGLIHIAELTIVEPHRRRGHGGRLLHDVLLAAQAGLAATGVPLRRAWVGVRHKSHVVGRSFLTRQGFHHVGSAPGVFRGEDMMVYVKSFD